VRTIRTVLAWCALVAACPAIARGAQADSAGADPWQDTISPDRPGAATPPTVLDRGTFQIETSIESASAQASGVPTVTTLDVPTLLRFGVGHALEFRLESNTLSHQASGVPGAPTGFADVSLEAKWSLIHDSAGLTPALALLPAVSIPSGSADFSAGKAQPGVGALLGWTLRSGTSLNLGAGATRVVDDAGDTAWQLGWEGAVGIPLQRHWAVSSDVFVTDPLEQGSSVEWGADAGVEFYPHPDTQLDVIASHTFGDPADATSVQIGFSRRWRLGR